jgi:hypothetical protein
MIPTITATQLNTCYKAINKAYKEGNLPSSQEFSLEIDKQLITFVFDKQIKQGQGAWIVQKTINVIYNEEGEEFD